MSKKEVTLKPEKAIIPIKWNIPDNIISRFASNIIVQSIEKEYKISFFEVKPDIRINKDDPLPKEVRADCVASIIMTPEKVKQLIDVLQKQLDRHNKIS